MCFVESSSSQHSDSEDNTMSTFIRSTCKLYDKKTNDYWCLIDSIPDVTKSAYQCTRNKQPIVKE